MNIKRKLILPRDRHFFLFGPRQTGKSTLIKSIFDSPDCLYYDLLRSELNRKFLANPEIFRAEVKAAVESKNITHVIIDEVQKIPALLDEVHSLITSGFKCSFVLSGSSSRKLKRVHANMLAGRGGLSVYTRSIFSN